MGYWYNYNSIDLIGDHCLIFNSLQYFNVIEKQISIQMPKNHNEY